jgi:hypothetical protein
MLETQKIPLRVLIGVATRHDQRNVCSACHGSGISTDSSPNAGAMLGFADLVALALPDDPSPKSTG